MGLISQRGQSDHGAKARAARVRFRNNAKTFPSDNQTFVRDNQTFGNAAQTLGNDGKTFVCDRETFGNRENCLKMYKKVTLKPAGSLRRNTPLRGRRCVAR